MKDARTRGMAIVVVLVCLGLGGCPKNPPPCGPEALEVLCDGACYLDDGGIDPDTECHHVGDTCQCVPLTSCIATDAPACDGVCEGPDAFCVSGARGCFCTTIKTPIPCGEYVGPPMCAGHCPAETPLCVRTLDPATEQPRCECRALEQ